MNIFYIVYAIRESKPDATVVVYCGRSLKSAEYYQSHCSVECGLYAQLPVGYFTR